MEKDRLEEIKMVHNAGNYAHRLDCRVCWLISRVEELEKLLKSQAPAGEFGPGTKGERAAGIPICCMAPEYRDCLDRVMEEWREHFKKLPLLPQKISDPDDVYGFAYWLIRWSGLVVPAESFRPPLKVFKHTLTDEEIQQIVNRPGGRIYYQKEETLRDFSEVINRIIEVIPDKHPAKLALSNVVQASHFKAPELMRDCWQNAATILECMIEPLDRGSEWALKVRDIFAGKEEPCPQTPE